MSSHSFDLAAAAATATVQAGFSTDFSPDVADQVAAIRAAAGKGTSGAQDMRPLLWSSIDNDTSRDLDQAEEADETAGGTLVRVAIANVAGSVARGSPIDQHAAAQTVTIYTPARIFPMLPVELSTDLTSLSENTPRAALVVEFTVADDGDVGSGRVCEALIENRAQLVYSRVGPWLEGGAAGAQADAKIAASVELQQQLRLQDRAAQALRAGRLRRGALEFERPEAELAPAGGTTGAMRSVRPNRANDLIEELMIAANETMARTLRDSGRSSLRRVVRSPERWGRIVQLAAETGNALPAEADSAALSAFLQARRTADPVHYPDLSLAVIKLMGPGEYVVARAGAENLDGHFGLATQDYTHATAPNRRFADLVLQRLLLSLLRNEAAPYTDDELDAIAAHCNERESAARKLERAMLKRAAALSLVNSIGQVNRGVITGASPKGTYVRLIDPPIEGRVTQAEQGLDVGDVVSVKLLRADPQLGFIDFARV